MALRISCPIPDTGPLAIPPKSYTAADSLLLKDCAGVKPGTAFTGHSFANTVQAAVDSIKQKAYTAAGIDKAQQQVMENFDQRGSATWRDTLLDEDHRPRAMTGWVCTAAITIKVLNPSRSKGFRRGAGRRDLASDPGESRGGTCSEGPKVR